MTAIFILVCKKSDWNKTRGGVELQTAWKLPH